MRRYTPAPVRALSFALALLLLLAFPPASRPGVSRAQEVGPAGFRTLVFTRTTGFRHDSIPDAVAAVRSLGAEHGFGVDATEDPTVFDDAQLAGYAAVVFLLTTGDVLDEAQQAAFERYIRAGGGYVGVHSATDTEYDWPWYGGLVGAYFADHPPGTYDRPPCTSRTRHTGRRARCPWLGADRRVVQLPRPIRAPYRT